MVVGVQFFIKQLDRLQTSINHFFRQIDVWQCPTPCRQRSNGKRWAGCERPIACLYGRHCQTMTSRQGWLPCSCLLSCWTRQRTGQSRTGLPPSRPTWHDYRRIAESKRYRARREAVLYYAGFIQDQLFTPGVSHGKCQSPLWAAWFMKRSICLRPWRWKWVRCWGARRRVGWRCKPITHWRESRPNWGNGHRPGRWLLKALLPWKLASRKPSTRLRRRQRRPSELPTTDS